MKKLACLVSVLSVLAGSVLGQYSGGSGMAVFVGAGTILADNPLSALNGCDARAQIIYRADEIGGGGTIASLGFNVGGGLFYEGEVMSQFTIRLKHTELDTFSEMVQWQTEDWTVVYQADETIPATGWAEFSFFVPFVYDGNRNLMVDISFKNSSYAIHRYCQATDLNEIRTLYGGLTSGTIDPIDWSETDVVPQKYSLLPDLKLMMMGNFVTVPDLAGLTLSQVEDALLTVGLKLGEVTEGYNGAVAEGLVAGQYPMRGDSILESFSVDVKISLGRIYSGGSGSAEDPFQIATAGDLVALGQNTALYKNHFVLTVDIDLEGQSFSQPVIAQTKDFAGVFDGKGHTIRNLTISAAKDYVGLFGTIHADGEVINLGLENVNISGWNCVGGLCGINYGSIRQAYVAGAITGYGVVGGLCGYNYDHGSIDQCYATGSVAGTKNNFIGGLCGRNDSFSTISQSYSTAKVTIAEPYFVAGGLCGFNLGLIHDCFWDTQSSGQARSSGGMGLGTVQMQTVDIFSLNGWAGTAWTMNPGETPRLVWEQAGGAFIPEPAVGMAGSGTVHDPWIIATVEDLVSISQGSFFWDKYLRLEADLDLTGVTSRPIGYDSVNCFSGSFDGGGHVLSNLTIPLSAKDSYVGLFGYMGMDGQVKNVGLENVDIKGGNYIGGLCGYSVGAISGCYSAGTVIGTNRWVGGLCGMNSGTIERCYSMVAVSGYDYVGGLCGRNDELPFTYTGACRIRECYSTGAVAGSSFTGGLCGASDKKINACFWDVQTSGKTGSAGGAGVVGKTMVEMQSIQTYLAAGWDFAGETANGTADIWHRPYGVTGYPLLWWQRDIPGDLAGAYGVNLADVAAVSAGWLAEYGVEDLARVAGCWLEGQ